MQSERLSNTRAKNYTITGANYRQYKLEKVSHFFDNLTETFGVVEDILGR